MSPVGVHSFSCVFNFHPKCTTKVVNSYRWHLDAVFFNFIVENFSRVQRISQFQRERKKVFSSASSRLCGSQEKKRKVVFPDVPPAQKSIVFYPCLCYIVKVMQILNIRNKQSELFCENYIERTGDTAEAGAGFPQITSD